MKQIIKNIILHILGTITRKKKYCKINKTEIETILVLAYTGIGNFILYIPALKLLRKEFPFAHITLQYGNNTGCEEITKVSNIFDDYIEIKSNLSIFAFIKEAILDRKKYDLIISEFHNNSWKLASEIVLFNAPYKIGHVSHDDWVNDFDFLYNYPVRMQQNDHEILRYLKLLEPLRISYEYNNEQKNTEIFLSNKNIRVAKEFLSYIDSNKQTIGIQVGTSPSMRWKQWPLENYQHLIKILQKDFNVLLVGDPSERIMIEELVNNIPKENIYIFAGNGTLLDAAGLISLIDLMITNDSGLMHIANSFNINLIAVYGPTDPNRTAPLGKKSIVLKKDYDCMPCFKMSGEEKVLHCEYKYKCLKDITIEDILDKIKVLLK